MGPYAAQCKRLLLGRVFILAALAWTFPASAGPSALWLDAQPAANLGKGGAGGGLEQSIRHGTMTRVQGGDIGANAAAAAARSATGGTVLRVRRSAQGANVVYLVKVLLPGGTVRTVRVDGASGAVQ